MTPNSTPFLPCPNKNTRQKYERRRRVAAWASWLAGLAGLPRWRMATPPFILGTGHGAFTNISSKGAVAVVWSPKGCPTLCCFCTSLSTVVTVPVSSRRRAISCLSVVSFVIVSVRPTSPALLSPRWMQPGTRISASTRDKGGSPAVTRLGWGCSALEPGQRPLKTRGTDACSVLRMHSLD
jgi:hypothetical protein